MGKEKRKTIGVSVQTRARLSEVQRLVPVDGRPFNDLPTMDTVINWIIDNCSALPGQTKKAT